jgi:hypothetical protein
MGDALHFLVVETAATARARKDVQLLAATMWAEMALHTEPDPAGPRRIETKLARSGLPPRGAMHPLEMLSGTRSRPPTFFRIAPMP